MNLPPIILRDGPVVRLEDLGVGAKPVLATMSRLVFEVGKEGFKPDELPPGLVFEHHPPVGKTECYWRFLQIDPTSFALAVGGKRLLPVAHCERLWGFVLRNGPRECEGRKYLTPRLQTPVLQQFSTPSGEVVARFVPFQTADGAITAEGPDVVYLFDGWEDKKV